MSQRRRRPSRAIETIEDVVETGGNEHHSGNAMHDAAHVFAHAENFGKP